MTTKKTTSKKKEVFDFRSIRTPEDAFKKQGMDPALLPDLSKLPERFSFLIVVFILAVIIEAINDGWKPDYSDHSQRKYFLWPWVSSSGLDFSYSRCNFGRARAFVGFPLLIESYEKEQYIFEQFPDLWKAWLLNVKPQ